MEKINQKFFRNLLTFLFWSFLFLITIYVAYGVTIIDDDLLVSVTGTEDNIFFRPFCFYNLFVSCYRGYIIPHIFNVMFGIYLPDFFHIHVNDFAMVYGALFRTSIFILTICLTTEIFFINQKKKFLYYVLTSLIVYITYCIMLFRFEYTFVGLTSFCRNFLFLFFIAVFIYYYTKYFVHNLSLNNIEKFIIYFNFLCLGCSGELAIIFVSIVFLYSFLFNLVNKKNLFFINKFFIVCFLCFCLGILFTLLQPEFYSNLFLKFSSSLDNENLDYLFHNKVDYIDMFCSFFKAIILKNLILIITNLLVIFLVKKTTKNPIYPLFILFFSVICMISCLAIPVRESYLALGYYGKYYFLHNDIQPAFGIFFLFCIASGCSILMKDIQKINLLLCYFLQ
jgi:hypothetical protein